jgi:nitrogenase subunit NifH
MSEADDILTLDIIGDVVCFGHCGSLGGPKGQ